MSRFDDESDDFNSPEETDSVIRELRAETVRQEARLDQLTASVREGREKSIAKSAQIAELEAVVDRLRARQRRDTKLLILAWLMVVTSLGLSLYTYFAS